MDKGLLVVVSGFSGAGKGTMMKRLLEKYPGVYALSVSATTREPRPGEADGREYFFVSTEEFEDMIAKNELIEHARYVNHYYGTPSGYVEKQREAGRDVLLEIELQGALQIRKRYPEAVLIFVAPPGAEELRRRLAGRGSETEEAIAARLNRAVEEAEYMENYDYLLINDDLETCVEKLHALIAGQHMRSREQLPFIHEMKKELKALVEGE
ncbi:MAG: guanylate kinase [Lachnospiraceae bacterium]|nr:guanylate kinase [Lachnospiraceae bacterium]